MFEEPSATLAVRLDGVQVRVLKAGCPPLTFGRGGECGVRLGPRGPQGDRHISRKAGSVHWEYGFWTVQNTGSRPFEILDPAAILWQPSWIWAIGPDGVEIKVNSPTRPYRIQLQPEGSGNGVDPSGVRNDGEPSTYPLPKPGPHERTLLAAKFLNLHQPGFAISNELAAQRANACGRTHPTTAKAVEDCARRWKERLQNHGVSGIEGRENANRLGCTLLAYGVIGQQDALPLPHVADGG